MNSAFVHCRDTCALYHAVPLLTANRRLLPSFPQILSTACLSPIFLPAESAEHLRNRGRRNCGKGRLQSVWRARGKAAETQRRSGGKACGEAVRNQRISGG